MTLLKNKYTLAFAAVFGLSVLASSGANAQGFSIFGHSFGSSPQQTAGAFDDMKRNVYAIDNLADKMAYQFKQELRSENECKGCHELYAQMKRHTGLTNDLIKAYKGSDARKFQRVANDVRASVSTLKRLQSSAKVSESVKGLIRQSEPMANYVAKNSSKIEVANR